MKAAQQELTFLDSDDIDADEEEIRDALEAMEDVGEHEEGDYILGDDKEIIIKVIEEELKNILDEKKKKRKKEEEKSSGKKDACYHKVRSRYAVWPSAYASGALVKCRKVGAKIGAIRVKRRNEQGVSYKHYKRRT